jgi:hypothetical protein
MLRLIRHAECYAWHGFVRYIALLQQISGSARPRPPATPAGPLLRRIPLPRMDFRGPMRPVKLMLIKRVRLPSTRGMLG